MLVSDSHTNGRPTVASKLQATVEWNNSAVVSTGSRVCLPGSQIVLTTRDPFHAYGYTVENSTALLTQWEYPNNGFGRTAGTINPGVGYMQISSSSSTASPMQYQMDPCRGFFNSLPPNAADLMQYPFFDHSRAWVFVSEGGSFTFFCAGGTTTTSDSIELVRHGETPMVFDKLNFTAGTGQSVGWTGLPMGYYAVNLMVTSVTASNPMMFYSQTINPPGNTLIYQSLPQINEHKTLLTQMRIIGATGLLSPTGNVLNRNGMCVGYQILGNESLTEAITSVDTGVVGGVDPVAVLSRKANSWTSPADKGMYGIHMPGEDSFRMRRTYNRVNSTSAIPCPGPPMPKDGIMVIAVTVTPDANGTTYSAMSFGFMPSYSVQFETDDQWAGVRMGGISEAEFKVAVQFLRTQRQFHENPMHWGDVWNFVKSAGRAMLRVSPAILVAMGLPQLAPFAAGASAAVEAYNEAGGSRRVQVVD